MDRGIISGTDDNELGLTMDIIRTLVIIDKTDGFENYTVEHYAVMGRGDY